MTMPTGILHGLVHQSIRIVDPSDRGLASASTVVIGPSGTDKSFFVKMLYRRARKCEVGLNLIAHRAENLHQAERGDTTPADAAIKLVLKRSETTIGAVDACFGLTSAKRPRPRERLERSVAAAAP